MEEFVKFEKVSNVNSVSCRQYSPVKEFEAFKEAIATYSCPEHLSTLD